MHYRSTPMRLSALAALTLTFSSGVIAQTGTPPASDSMETITVSATPVRIDDAGSSVSVITREDIRRRNAANLTQLLREVPGFALSQQGAEGSVSQLRIRGAEANQILVLINGVEANDLAQGSEFDFSQVTVTDIERIEIVRGPQSALWGSDAMAGVVHIITRPDSPTTGIEVGAETGSFGTSRINLVGQYGSERSRLKLSVDHLDTEGTNISRTGNEKDGLENTTVGLAGSYAPTDNVDLKYSIRHTDKTTEFDGTDFVNTGLPVDADNETQSEYLYANVAAYHTINTWLDHGLSFSRTDSDNKTINSGVQSSVTRGTRDALRYQVNASRAASRLSVMLEHEQEEFTQSGQASAFGDPNQHLQTDTDSIALEYRYDGELLNLSLSGRRDRNSDFEDATSWRATGNINLDAVIIYASIGESVKNPTFVERFGFFTNFIGNPDLEPERSLQWEVGMRGNYLDERLDLAATYFHANLEDEINGFVFDPVTFGFTSENVDGKSRREGVELEATWRATGRFDVRATYTYLDATQEDATGSDIIEVRRPRHSGSLSMNYTWPNAGVSLAASYTGEQEDDYFPPAPPFQERVDLPGFTLVNLSGYYDLNEHTTLTARVENATDEDYEQVYGFASPGLAAYVGVRLRW